MCLNVVFGGIVQSDVAGEVLKLLFDDGGMMSIILFYAYGFLHFNMNNVNNEIYFDT